jgi:hypothetical protein
MVALPDRAGGWSHADPIRGISAAHHAREIREEGVLVALSPLGDYVCGDPPVRR